MSKEAEKKSPKVPKPSAKFAGKSCELCGRKYEPHPKTGKYPRFITHHLSYEPEITAVVCLSCHNWMSGTGPCYSHPLKKKDCPANEKGLAPFLFALGVVDLYRAKLIVGNGRVIIAKGTLH